MKPKTNAEQSLEEFETVLSKVVIGVAIVLGAGLILHLGAHQSEPEAAQARAAPATPSTAASDDRNIRVVYPTPYTSAARNERLSSDSRQQAIPAPVVSLASAAVSSETRASETTGLVTHETLNTNAQ